MHLLRRIERYLTAAWASGARPVVLLNKADLASDRDTRLRDAIAVAPGAPSPARPRRDAARRPPLAHRLDDRPCPPQVARQKPRQHPDDTAASRARVAPDHHRRPSPGEVMCVQLPTAVPARPRSVSLWIAEPCLVLLAIPDVVGDHRAALHARRITPPQVHWTSRRDRVAGWSRWILVLFHI